MTRLNVKFPVIKKTKISKLIATNRFTLKSYFFRINSTFISETQIGTLKVTFRKLKT